MKINSIKFRDKKTYQPSLNTPPKSYQIVDVDFEIGNQQFIYSFAVFSDDFLDALPKIKREVGNYLVHQLFQGYDAINKLKK